MVTPTFRSNVLVPENAGRPLLDAYRAHDVERASILVSTDTESETPEPSTTSPNSSRRIADPGIGANMALRSSYPFSETTSTDTRGQRE